MLNIYNTDLKTNKFEKIKEFRPGSWISLVNPSEEEIKEVCSNLKIEDEFIKYPLDYEEQARIDMEDDMTLFVIDVPIIEDNKEEKVYTTMPLGLIVVRDEFFITVSLKKNRIIDNFEKGRIKGMYTYKKTRFVLQILYLNASYYLTDLKRINKSAENTVGVLKRTMKNEELIQLLNLENSLVYITTSLKANELVMEKTGRGKILKAYEEDDEILGNYIVDLDFPTLILARSEFLTIVDLIDLTFIGNYSIAEIKEQIKKDSLCYLPIIYSLLDNYLAIDFNHSKSK